MSAEHLIVFGVIGFFTSILSGMAGGGGGFIMTPLAIFLGLTPQQAVATGKINGLAISLGSLHGFRHAKLHSWKKVIPIMIIAAVIGLTAPFAITRIDNDAYRRLIGGLLLLMIPVLILNRKGKFKRENPSIAWKISGYVLLTLTFLLQALFNSGVGMLINIALMVFMGMSSLEANVSKRFGMVVINMLVVVGVLFSHLIIWSVALTVVAGSFIGSRLGAKIALKKGDGFVTIVYVVIMLASGLELIFG